MKNADQTVAMTCLALVQSNANDVDHGQISANKVHKLRKINENRQLFVDAAEYDSSFMRR